MRYKKAFSFISENYIHKDVGTYKYVEIKDLLHQQDQICDDLTKFICKIYGVE